MYNGAWIVNAVNLVTFGWQLAVLDTPAPVLDLVNRSGDVFFRTYLDLSKSILIVQLSVSFHGGGALGVSGVGRLFHFSTPALSQRQPCEFCHCLFISGQFITALNVHSVQYYKNGY